MQKKIVYIALLLAVLIVFPGKAMAVPGDLDTFNMTYGCSDTVLNTCNLGHPGDDPGSFNPYANLYKDDFSLCDAGVCPNWETVDGAWVGKPGTLSSSEEQNDMILVMNIPTLEQFGAGRLESRISLTGKVGSNTEKVQTVTAQPNASIIFGYVDSSHYRYGAIQSNNVYIGQVGDYEGETQGTKAVGNVAFPVGQWHRLRVDIQPTGEVSVFVDPQGGAADRAVASYSFGTAAKGRVGYSAKKVRSSFADFNAWDTGVLP